jgi:oligoribonuclease NrnB/cAMP/cGMP phosphodiesterase (DHH superfamily)
MEKMIYAMLPGFLDPGSCTSLNKILDNGEKIFVKIYEDCKSSEFQFLSSEAMKIIPSRGEEKNLLYININYETGNIAFRSNCKISQKVAKAMGGGGHPNAAGTAFDKNDKSFVNNKAILIEMIESALTSQE